MESIEPSDLENKDGIVSVLLFSYLTVLSFKNAFHNTILKS